MFRWGIFGTGAAARKFVLGLRDIKDALPVVVASRSRANAEKFAQDFSIPVVAAGYREAAELDAADAFYIATPPSKHVEHALLCVNARKPVLVEKPFAVHASGAKEIIQAARDKSVFCMEGMWTRFLPLVRHLCNVVSAGEIGDCRLLTGHFCVPMVPDPSTSLFNVNLGGGALLHRGVYPLSLACHLMGRPANIFSQAILSETGVDEDSTLGLQHAQGGLSIVYASLRTQSPNDLTIMGTRGTIHVHSPIYRPFRMTLSKAEPKRAPQIANARLESMRESHFFQSLHQRSFGVLAGLVRNSRSTTVTKYYRGNGYQYEAQEVMQCVRAGKIESDVLPLSESLAVVEAMDLARAQWASVSAGVKPS